MGAKPVKDRLVQWLRRAASEPAGVGERDYLSELAAAEQVAVVASADPDVGPAEYASALLVVARDGEAAGQEAVLNTLGGADARWWLAVDEALRHRWWSAPRWSQTIAADLADGEVNALPLVVAACHHNGRIREAAVVRLADQQHPAAVAVLALRACDWADQVRQSARTVLAGWSWPALPDEALTTLAELAFALRTRREGGWLAGRVDDLLQDLPAQELEPLLSARDRRVRRAAYRAAIVSGRLDLDQLVRAAVQDHDLPIRAMSARAAVQAAVDPTQLRTMLASRTALVRVEALREWVRSGDLAVAEAALSDRHPLVREIAQEAWRRAGSDPAEYYRRLALLSPAEPAVIAGLGETGGSDDVELVARWLAHPQTRGRVEAIRALRRLGTPRPAELVALLRDESPAVTRQAVATLRRDIGVVDPAVLTGLLSPANPPHVRFGGYRLLTGGDAWQRLVTNLRLIDDPDARLRVSSRADIAAWLDREAARTFRAPSPDRAVELDSLLEQGRPILGEGKIALLRFHAGLTAAA